MHQEILQEVVRRIDQIEAMVRRIESLMVPLIEKQKEKESYTTIEVAMILGRADFTVREWCRNKRAHAVKRACGRGNSQEWSISRKELNRLQNEGLLPIVKNWT